MSNLLFLSSVILLASSYKDPARLKDLWNRFYSLQVLGPMFITLLSIGGMWFNKRWGAFLFLGCQGMMTVAYGVLGNIFQVLINLVLLGVVAVNLKKMERGFVSDLSSHKAHLKNLP